MLPILGGFLDSQISSKSVVAIERPQHGDTEKHKNTACLYSKSNRCLRKALKSSPTELEKKATPSSSGPSTLYIFDIFLRKGVQSEHLSDIIPAFAGSCARLCDLEGTDSDAPFRPMSANPKSRWADEEESPETVAQRKQEKEDKRRLKEEKLRRTAELHASPPRRPDQATNPVNDESERPAKRRRMSIETRRQRPPSQEQDSKLLPFSTTYFGPCKDVEEYELLNNIEEGSYGMVSRARTKATGEVVALKRLKMEHTSDGFPVTGLREIQTLMASRHNNIVKLREVVMGGSMNE